jgi:hypothetical protein
MTKNQFLIGMLLGLLMVSVQANAVITTAPTASPSCPAPGELSLIIADQAGTSDSVDFDEITTYYDDNLDSRPLMLKKGLTVGNDYKFYSYDKDLKNVAVTVCTSSATN